LLIGRTADDKLSLSKAVFRLAQASNSSIAIKKQEISNLQQPLASITKRIITETTHVLAQKELQLTYTNPLSILQKGYTINYSKGKRVTSKKSLQAGDTLTTAFHDGTVESVVKASK
jgi:exodeoxyribonuclease VII large subunit